MNKKLIAITLAFLAIMTARPVRAFDERVTKMNKVLTKYNSPMAGHEVLLIKTAEKHGLDWTLLAAIAGTESSFGKRMPSRCINPYGWGIYGANRLCFATMEEAIEKVGEGLGTRYNTSSLATIARTYNKVSTEGWINHTTYFMNKIKNANVSVSELPITL